MWLRKGTKQALNTLWECKLVQPLHKTIQYYLAKLKSHNSTPRQKAREILVGGHRDMNQNGNNKSAFNDKK